MKKRLLLVVVFIGFAFVANAQTANGKELPWDYPVKPGTEEWKQLKTHQDVLDVCQIPEEVFSTLSTDDLAEICLQVPILGAELHIPHDRGLDSLYKNFNGVRELMKRKDAIKGLLNWYEKTVQNFSFLNGDASDVEKGFFAWKVIAAQLLLSRCQLPDEANKNDYVEIVRQLVNGYEKMPEYPKTFGDFSLGVNCFARARIIFNIDKKIYEKIPDGESNPIFTRSAPDMQAMRFIDEISYQIINEK